MARKKQIEFEKRVIGYLEQAGWRVEAVTALKGYPRSFGSSYVAYPEFVAGPVAGRPISSAFCQQMQRDFEAGVPGRFLTFPDKTGEASGAEKEGEDG